MSLSISSVGFQGTSQTNKKKGAGGPPPEILAQLQQYGLSPQGSKEADLAAIQRAKSQQNQQNQQSGELQTNPLAGKKMGGKGKMGPPPEILAMLQKFGLSPQGSKEADLAAIQQAQSQQGQSGLGQKLNLIG